MAAANNNTIQANITECEQEYTALIVALEKAELKGFDYQNLPIEVYKPLSNLKRKLYETHEELKDFLAVHPSPNSNEIKLEAWNALELINKCLEETGDFETLAVKFAEFKQAIEKALAQAH